MLDKFYGSQGRARNKSIDVSKSDINPKHMRRDTKFGSKGKKSKNIKTLQDKFDYYYKPYNLTDEQYTAHIIIKISWEL